MFFFVLFKTNFSFRTLRLFNDFITNVILQIQYFNMKKGILILGISSLILTSCGESKKNKTTESKDSHNTEMHSEKEHHNEEMHENHSMETLPIEKRVAFMSGHVEVGLALYRAGKPDQAAKHLLHPVSETHQAERAGIDALGFKPNVFKSVSKALDEGKPASDIEPMLIEAEENMSLLQKNVGGNTNDIIEFLMETIEEEYNEGVSNGKIVEAGEYQDAFGFSVVALKMSKRIQGDKSEELKNELIKLVEMWPKGGPLADSKPESVENIVNQTKNIITYL